MESDMFKKLIFVIPAFFMAVSFCDAKEISGVNIPETLEAGQVSLSLNGAGVRSKFFVKVYVGGLYLQQKSDDPVSIIETDDPMAIRLQITSSMITSEKMENATREGFSNATNGDVAPIKDQIDKFISVFKEIKENDIFDLIYIPGKGTEVYKNSEYHSIIEGLPFKQALFGIWLCDKPAQKSLKNDMLGK
jgi:hypothetical protein